MNQKSVSEKEVGIISFLSKTQPFPSILKQRYSDFIVNEIDENRKVVYLTNKNYEEEETEKPTKSTNLEGFKQIKEIFSEEISQKFEEFLKNLQNSKKIKIQNSKKFFQFPEIESKETRKRVHEIIRDNFENLISKTDDKNSIITQEKTGNIRYWPSNRPVYLKFVLYKENQELNGAISLISRLTRIGPKIFSYAGIKDKRGITTQNITAFKVEAQKLEKINSRLRKIQLGNFEYIDNPINLGQLWGNRFIICLRDIKGNDEEIIEATNSLKNKGFINYFGLQRFGSSSIPTHKIGIALIQKDWKKAVELILENRPNDTPDITQARDYYFKEKNPAKAFNAFPKSFIAERSVLANLKKQKDNFKNAIFGITRNLRMLYGHSLQSYLFNWMTTTRIQQNQDEILEGDLVLIDSNPYIVKKEDIESKKFSIEDVVLPIPGEYSIFPQNQEVLKTIEEKLSKENITMDQFKEASKELLLTGDYRNIIQIPQNVQFEIVYYSEPDELLLKENIESLDIDLSQKVLKSNTDSFEDNQKKLKGLILQFDLKSSDYATMCIREITKMDTSTEIQTKLARNSKKRILEENENEKEKEKEN
ncbi:pseudouridylate synthase 7 [Anaeramoeba ignava]|uniref:Pseudouridylate synthase 7 n=1 Tax=Anaeramoeba ignava TaxID=1746090 RepID=A0A9Q0L9J9_ANAIG|nr:pseudouridylate synthase 7 [Anaeramoeba ignava]